MGIHIFDRNRLIMRILHISHTDINFDSRILKELAAISGAFPNCEMAALGAELVNAKHEKSNDLYNIEIKTIPLKSRNFEKIPKILRQIGIVFEMYVRMRSAVRNFRPDIVHAHDTVALFVAVTAKRAETKVIYDAHELESDRNGLKLIQRLMVRIFEKVAWSRVDHLIVVGELIGDWYAKNIGNKPMTVILNSPISTSNLTVKTNYLRERLSIDEDRKIFIYVGALMPGRMIEKYVDIFAQPNFPADIVFLGSGDLDQMILRQSQSVKNIHLHYSVPHNDVVSIVRSADVGLAVIERVSLSDYLCLPNKLFEYAFAGVPSLVSNFPAMENYSNKFNLGWTTNVSKLALEQAILRIVDDTEYQGPDLKKLAEVGWDRQAIKLINLYDELM